MSFAPDDDSTSPLTAEVRFTNGYRLTVGPSRPDGRRDVRVHDEIGRAAGHTAVESIADLKTLAARVRGHPPVAGRRVRFEESQRESA